MKHSNISNILTLASILCVLCGCQALHSWPDANKPQKISHPEQPWQPSNNSKLASANIKAYWQVLQEQPLKTLVANASTTSDPSLLAWLKLAIIHKQYSRDSQKLSAALQQWLITYPNHPAGRLIPSLATIAALSQLTRPHHIALLLPTHGLFANATKAIHSGFLQAYYKNNSQLPNKQIISFYDSSTTNATSIIALYQQAITAGAEVIVGPLNKDQITALQQYNNFTVPVLALNYTPIPILERLPNNFYEFGLSPEIEVKQLATTAQQLGCHQALIIAINNHWGHRLASALTELWQHHAATISDTLYLEPNADFTTAIAQLLHIDPQTDHDLTRHNNNKSLLTQQRRQDFDVIFIFTPATMGQQIVPLLKFYYAATIPIYASSAIYSGKPNPNRDNDLNAVHFTEIPWLIYLATKPAMPRISYDRLYAVGYDAYLLSNNLTGLQNLANFPIYGATGRLSMQQQQIHQQLSLVTMQHGYIEKTPVQ